MKSVFCDMLGIEVVETGEGWSHLRAVVGPQHTNFHNTAHGSFLYALADEAFALACNSRGPAVALSTRMDYFRPVRAGDVVEARAREVHVGGRTSTYEVELSSGGSLVALFIGMAYRLSDGRQPPPGRAAGF